MKTIIFLLMLSLVLLSCQKSEEIKPERKGFIKIEVKSLMADFLIENDTIEIFLSIDSKEISTIESFDYIVEPGQEVISFITKIPVIQNESIIITVSATGVKNSYTRLELSSENIISRQFNLKKSSYNLNLRRDFLNLYGFEIVEN